MEYARPSVDNLINNLPSVLRSSRQFLAWNLERGEKKVPLKPDGRTYGDYKDPNCWRTLNDAIDLLDRRRAFGIGLVLPSPEQINTLPEFNLITGLVAFDADAKRWSMATPYNVPAHISDYIRSANSYSEFSPSLKGLRALAFGSIPTENQNITRRFGDGTELSLYRGGWVTLSGLPFGDSPPTIEHRQQAIDRIVAELWPEYNVGNLARIGPAKAALPSLHEGENFILDWGRTVSEDRIRQFIQGLNRTPKQLADIMDTWELKRGWNHGYTPDSSMYTKRIVEEALWLQPRFGWTDQDVVDIVVTFCKKNQLRWTFGRAKKQLADGLAYIDSRTCQRGGGCVVEFDPHLFEPTPPPTLTCNGAQIIEEQNRGEEHPSSTTQADDLPIETALKSRDTFGSKSKLLAAVKLSRHFRNKSVVRDAIIDAVKQYRGWVKTTTIAEGIGVSLEATKKQLQRLRLAGCVDGDGKGHYRSHREHQPRPLKPCSLKPIPKCRGADRERKMLSRSELAKRGWPRALIAKILPVAGEDYIEKEIVVDDFTGRVVKARLYWVSRIKQIECQPWFEVERTKFARHSRTIGVEHRGK